jgi:hypothetical protein
MNTQKLWRKKDDKVIAGICSGLGQYFNSDTVSLQYNHWDHYAIVGEANTNQLRIYKNGVLDATYARTGSQTPGNLRIGSNDNGTGEFYNGDLPIVRMYSTALSQSQIIQNFNSQKSRFGL